MSLFGDESEQPASRPKSSLFDDDSAAQASKPTSSSMFGDATPEATDSPWGFTPKKSTANRGSLVKSLLAEAEVPDLYIDTFDGLQSGGNVSAKDGKELAAGSGVNSRDQDKIMEIVTSRGASEKLGRSEFNVLLALIGLAQEGEEVSLDAVDERRSKLPVPSLPAKQQQQQQQPPPATPQSQPGAASLDNDPWASPDMHKGHKHPNGVANGGAQRTTSTLTTNAAADPPDSTASGAFGNAQPAQNSETASWGGSTFGAGGSGDGFSHRVTGRGFDEEGNGSSAPQRPAAVPRNTTSKGAEEVVTVNLLEEKEGMFMFQHRNYEVSSVRRASKVIRRYSDFVWLLDCLHKRYPFRQLPLLPPKRVAINGNHIAADTTFLEKRRRGLARFANALVRHPVLREEQLVVMFLTVPTVDACAYPKSHC